MDAKVGAVRYTMDQLGNGNGVVDQKEALSDLDGVANHPVDGQVDAQEEGVILSTARSDDERAALRELVRLANGERGPIAVDYSAPAPPPPRAKRRLPGG